MMAKSSTTNGNNITAKTHGAVLYTRVSTGEQDKHGTSPETQRDACRQKALALGLPIIAEYYDGGISGGFLLTRREFQAAVADIHAGRADTLICPSISRYSRDVEHQQSVKKAVKAAGGRLVFCDAEYEDTAAGDLNFVIQGGFAEYEKKVIRERTMGGRQKNAKNGQQPARATPPFGYHIVTKADVLRGNYPAGQLGQYQIVEDEAEVVRELFTRYASGADSLNGLAKWLNAASVKRPGKAAYWWASALRYLLQNSVYKGEAHYGQQMHRMEESRLTQLNPQTGQPFKQATVRRPAEEGYTIDLACPAIVTEAVWQQVSIRLSQNQNNLSGNPDRVRMLTGKVACPLCGGRMVITGTGRNTYVNTRGEKVFYPKDKRYACDRSRKVYSASGTAPCGSASYMIRRVEEAAQAAILSAARQDASLADALREWEVAQKRKTPKEGQGRAGLQQEKRCVEDALTALAARQEAAVQAQIAGIMAGASPDAYAAAFAAIAAERKDLEDRRGVLARALKAHEMKAHEQNVHEQSAAPALPEKPQPEKFKTRALEMAYEVLTSPDVPNTKKRQIVGTLIEKVVCRMDGADVWFLPGVIEPPQITPNSIEPPQIGPGENEESPSIERNLPLFTVLSASQQGEKEGWGKNDIQAGFSFQADTLQSYSIILALTRI